MYSDVLRRNLGVFLTLGMWEFKFCASLLLFVSETCLKTKHSWEKSYSFFWKGEVLFFCLHLIMKSSTTSVLVVNSQVQVLARLLLTDCSGSLSPCTSRNELNSSTPRKMSDREFRHVPQTTTLSAYTRAWCGWTNRAPTTSFTFHTWARRWWRRRSLLLLLSWTCA